MLKRIIPVAFILGITILLVWQRFDTEPEVNAFVIASTSNNYEVGDRLRRGQTVYTQSNEYVAFSLDKATIGLSENTSIELKRLFETERILFFSRGRMVVDNPVNAPVFVDTLKTQNTITKAKTSLINFDFLQTVHLIPLEGSIQTTLIGTNEYLILPVPVSVNESNTPSFDPIDFNPDKNAASNFYTWFDTIKNRK